MVQTITTLRRKRRQQSIQEINECPMSPEWQLVESS